MEAKTKNEEHGSERRISGRSRADIKSLTPISEALGGDKSPKEILQLILRAAFSITRASSASLMLIDPATNMLRVEVAEGFKDKRIYHTHLALGQGVTGWVAETGVPLRLGNVHNDPRYVRVQSDLRSELAVPLKIGGRVIGVISVDATRLNHFTAEDEALLLTLAAQSARVIHSTRLYEEARRRAEELELLSEVSRGFSGTLDLREIQEQAVKQTARVCQAEIVAIFLIGDGGAHLHIAACHGGSEEFRRQPPIVLKNSLLGRLIAGGKAAIIPHVQAENNSQTMTLDPSVDALLAVPLPAKGKALGILCVFGAKGRAFDAHTQRLLENLARTAAMAIENARTHQRVLAAEETLRRAEKFSMLGELAANLAHEIRNPLTSIKVLFGALRGRGVIPANAQQDAEMITKQIARLELIVEGFLNTARAQSSPVEMKPLELNSLVDEAMLLLASSAGEGMRLMVNLCPGELPINGDATQLSQVIHNLVLNALQAVDKGGRVNVATSRRESWDNKKGEVVLEIADDGPGISEVMREKLYQPFVTTKKGGVGLGLLIVKRIVEAHGGKQEIESPRKDIGRGAIFRVVLPLA
jgi:signal transduction histidine kinase